MLLGFCFGVVGAVGAGTMIYRAVRQNEVRRASIVTISIVAFGVLAIPASRLMTHLEHKKRYRGFDPNQVIGKAAPNNLGDPVWFRVAPPHR